MTIRSKRPLGLRVLMRTVLISLVCVLLAGYCRAEPGATDPGDDTAASPEQGTGASPDSPSQAVEVPAFVQTPSNPVQTPQQPPEDTQPPPDPTIPQEP
ncbi:MAG: hypothetical protein HXX11_04555 [Desulfuromonadales bacterium]|nr:hypothetical protein [Desulfuromonadales bacterium]